MFTAIVYFCHITCFVCNLILVLPQSHGYGILEHPSTSYANLAPILAPLASSFSNWYRSSFNHWFHFWFEVFIFCLSFAVFLHSWNSNVFMSSVIFRKNSSIFFWNRFDIYPQVTCWRVVFFGVFKKKSKLCLEIVIFSWVVEFLDNILAVSLKRDCSKWGLRFT